MADTPVVSPSPRGERDVRWKRAVVEHQAALRSFLDTAGQLTGDDWMQPYAPGKWSPAQVAEHLALAYEALLRELESGEGMRARAPAWQQRILRWVLLPHILFHRSFPLRARAPRETRPPEADPDREAVLARLADLAARFESGAHTAPAGVRFFHPYFGRISTLRALRFCAVHLEHHRKQIQP